MKNAKEVEIDIGGTEDEDEDEEERAKSPPKPPARVLRSGSRTANAMPATALRVPPPSKRTPATAFKVGPATQAFTTAIMKRKAAAEASADGEGTAGPSKKKAKKS